MTRRLFLLLASALALLLQQACRRQPTVPVRFDHGVASGDPLADGVILWTRLTPLIEEPLPPQLDVEWSIARDEALTEMVASGTTTTDAGRDFTVKVDAGSLEPATTYYYAFASGGTRSAVGRTRTLPEGPTAELNLAVISCSNYPAGYFHAYRSAAGRDDLDLALHLGDYIYEYGRGGYASEQAAELGREVLPPGELLSLDDYRDRYAQYRTDPDLQEVHRRLPFIVVWDDHEIANNTWLGGAENHSADEGEFAARRAAAVQAYREWMPIREHESDSQDRIYRSFQLGDLATLIMLDTRLIGRDEQLSYSELESLDQATLDDFRTSALGRSERSLLGAEQEAWLRTELGASKERGTPWQLIGQQLLMGRLELANIEITGEGARADRLRRLVTVGEADLPFNLDAWDGYPGARARFAADVLAHANNVVVLSGDSHNSWAFELRDTIGTRFAVELGTPAVNSPGLEHFIPLEPATLQQRLVERNEELLWVDTRERGYLILNVTPAAVTGVWHFTSDIKTRAFTERVGAQARVAATTTAGAGSLEITV